MNDDEFFDLLEEISQEREEQRDKDYWEKASAKPLEKPVIADSGEECVGG